MQIQKHMCKYIPNDDVKIVIYDTGVLFFDIVVTSLAVLQEVMVQSFFWRMAYLCLYSVGVVCARRLNTVVKYAVLPNCNLYVISFMLISVSASSSLAFLILKDNI